MAKWTNAIAARLTKGAMQVAIDDWQAPLAWSNTWGTDSPTVGFYKDPFGIVRIRGRCSRGTPVGALANEVIFTLPVGYRPTQVVRFEVTDGATSGSVAGNIGINVAGELRPGVRTGSTDQQVTLDAISFRVSVDG